MANKAMGILIIFLMISGCTSGADRVARQDPIPMIQKKGWEAVTFKTDNFDISGFKPGLWQQIKILTIYIEGDGLAWLSRSRVSSDPTPIYPMGLALALAHPRAGQALYLARPFQFGQKRNINRQYWTHARFAPQVIQAYAQILDDLKQKNQFTGFHLVGYSGGGGIAALLAARRNDVTLLITVAGNLDHRAWTKHHRVSSLSESLNPADHSAKLALIPQVHFYGEKDRIIPGSIAAAYAQSFPDRRLLKIVPVPDMGHGEGWDLLWPKLYDRALAHFHDLM
ncbi:MAG: alpha/beta hydrolase [Proteobacteria bacterium]|nr:alpha/beta hydrolase [Pseudomonadota bacterium]